MDAIEAALLFCAGRNRYVAIVGPSGWGKTHLMKVVANRHCLEGPRFDPPSAQQYLGGQGRYEGPQPLVLDDVQDALPKAKQRLALRIALERRMRAGRPTILSFTSGKPNRDIYSLLPNRREWVVASMGEPLPEERMLVLDHMARAEGLTLSPRLTRVLAAQIHGNGRTLAGALKRLRLSGTDWLESESVLRALGHLEPFFKDNSSWDLKHRILKLAERHRAQFPRANWVDLAVYVMHREAGFPESEIAQAAGLSHFEVYNRSLRFQKQCEGCTMTAAYVGQFVEVVLARILRD